MSGSLFQLRDVRLSQMGKEKQPQATRQLEGVLRESKLALLEHLRALGFCVRDVEVGTPPADREAVAVPC